MNVLPKEYKLFKIKGYNAEQLKTFFAETRGFEISSINFLTQCKNGFIKLDRSEHDSEDELDLIKGAEYEIYDQGNWIRAEYHEEDKGFYMFIVKPQNKDLYQVRISKDSGNIVSIGQRASNTTYKILEKFRR